MKENVICIVKFVLFLSVVCVFCLCTPIDKKVYEAKKDVFYFKTSNDCVVNQIIVTHFTYNEHDYIMFGDGNGKTIVHDPDCPCHKHIEYTSESEYNSEHEY